VCQCGSSGWSSKCRTWAGSCQWLPFRRRCCDDRLLGAAVSRSSRFGPRGHSLFMELGNRGHQLTPYLRTSSSTWSPFLSLLAAGQGSEAVISENSFSSLSSCSYSRWPLSVMRLQSFCFSVTVCLCWAF